MTLNNFFLLSPEISLVVLAGVIVLVDLVIKRKGLLPAFTLVALAVPLVLCAVLWVDLDANNNNALTRTAIGTYCQRFRRGHCRRLLLPSA